MCWYCRWGWPKPIADIYDEALRQLDGNDSPMLYGPAHVVWDDENFKFAEWCLANFDETKGYSKYHELELDVVRESLQKLVLVPRMYRDLPLGWEYDAENHPPPVDWEMRKR